MNALTFAAPTDVIADVLDSVAPQRASDPAVKGGLAGAHGTAYEAACKEAWVRFRVLVEQCARDGYDATRAAIADFVTRTGEVADELGAAGQAFRQHVLGKIRDTIVATFDALLGCMRSRVELGGRSYVLDSINLEHKLVYSGSLEASLTALCKFVGTGEMVVKGAYTLERGGPGSGATEPAPTLLPPTS